MQTGELLHTGHSVAEGSKGRGAWQVRFYQKDGNQKCVRLGAWLGEPPRLMRFASSAAQTLARLVMELVAAPAISSPSMSLGTG
jgi:hypothetical protein